MYRRPHGPLGEIRLSAVGHVAQDDLGDAGEQDTCSAMLDGAALSRQATGVQNLQSSQEKNTTHAKFLAPVQVQLGYNGQGQCQDDQIDHALENPRNQPESVIVDAVSGVGVAVLPRPCQRNAVQEVGHRSRDPECHDCRFGGIYLYPEGPADGEDAVEEEQQR